MLVYLLGRGERNLEEGRLPKLQDGFASGFDLPLDPILGVFRTKSLRTAPGSCPSVPRAKAR